MKVFVAPYGSVIPTDSQVRAVAFTNFRELVAATNNLETDHNIVCLIPSNIEVLRLAIKYAEYFDLEFLSFEGVPGGNYDMMWDQVIYPLERVSFTIYDDNLRHEHKPAGKKSGAQQARAELARYEAERPNTAPKHAGPPKATAWDDASDEDLSVE